MCFFCFTESLGNCFLEGDCCFRRVPFFPGDLLPLLLDIDAVPPDGLRGVLRDDRRESIVEVLPEPLEDRLESELLREFRREAELLPLRLKRELKER